MFRIENENELRECFRALDRSSVEVPAAFNFPIFVRDYLAWGETSGARTFVVFADSERRKTFGVAFRRDAGGGAGAYHCEWCHSFGGAGEIGLLTASVSDRRRVGIHLCTTLDCLEKISRRANASGENSRLHSRRLNGTMVGFARRYLF